MSIITVVGGSDSAIAVTVDGSEAVKLTEQFRDDLLTHYYTDHDLGISTFSSDGNLYSTFTNPLVEGAIVEGGQYNADDKVDYLVVGGLNERGVKTPNLLNDPVTINSSMSAGKYIRIVAGNDISRLNINRAAQQAAVEYHANKENGNFTGGSVNNPIYFVGNETDGGNWDIVTGNGNDTIISGSGNNTIAAGDGSNIVSLGGGNNSVNSTGHDTITAPFDGGYNTITLKGGQSQVNVGTNSVVNDVSSNNVITVGGGSTVVGGSSGSVTFNSVNDEDPNAFIGGDHNTITATADNLKVVHGSDNKLNVTGDFRFFNGIGETYSTITGSNKFDNNSQIFGAKGLDYHLTAENNSHSVMFVAGVGNETLDASASSSNLLIYANTLSGATSSNTKFLAVGGSGNDSLQAGVGSSTLTGGDGDNLFIFDKDSDNAGNTVITDFSKSKGNHIEFMDYGFNQNDISNILKNAKNDDKGNAVLDLHNHKLTLQGVSVSDLDVSQFVYYNSPKK